MTTQDIIAFCLCDPEAASWLDFFDDPDPMSSLSGEAPESMRQSAFSSDTSQIGSLLCRLDRGKILFF